MMNDSLDMKLTVDPHNLSGELQMWDLKFELSCYTPEEDRYNRRTNQDLRERIRIRLLAGRGEGSMRNTVELGTARIIAGEKLEKIKMTVFCDSRDFVKPLMEQYGARYIGEYTERHQDYPGADEIEEFNWQFLDIADFFNRYVEMKQKQLPESPLDNIGMLKKEGRPYNERPQHMVCDIGGVRQDIRWCGGYNDYIFELAEKYPEYTFQLHDFAAKIYAKELQTYDEAQNRVTDVTVKKIRPDDSMGWGIRCKIDGQQQMFREVRMKDVADYVSHQNGIALAAKYFNKELEQDITLAKCLGR